MFCWAADAGWRGAPYLERKGVAIVPIGVRRRVFTVMIKGTKKMIFL
jgi:hypothetical protein